MLSKGGTKDSPAKRQEAKLAEIKKQTEAIKTHLIELHGSGKDLLKFTDLGLSDLRHRLAQNSVTPKQLLHAFQLKCIKLYEQGNSGICELIREADEQVDNLYDKNIIRSELHGIPISVKELCSVKGYDATYGVMKLCQVPSKDDCIIVKALKAVGAIPFVLTATSQGAITVSGFNPVFGNMYNPYTEKMHEPGGSSNGEAVLIAKNGSPVGIGTDLAGSIRIPSAFCGLAGLKPTANRLSSYNLSKPSRTSTIMNTAVGPMGKRVEDLAMVMRALLRKPMFQLDPSVPPMAFNESVYNGKDQAKLRIGYYEELEDPRIVKCVPSVRRAMRNAVRILQQKGHELIPFVVPNIYAAFQLAFRALAFDGGQAMFDVLDGETLNDHSKRSKQFAGIPHAFRALADRGIQRQFGAPAAMAQFIKKASTADQLMDLMQEVQDYRMQFFNAWIRENELDVVIGPAWATPAPEVTTEAHFVTPSVIYTLLYNMLDLPAGVVPMGSVQSVDLEDSTKLQEQYKKAGDSYYEKYMQLQLNSIGLPLSVQVVGLPYCEELVLRVMKDLEAGLKR